MSISNPKRLLAAFIAILFTVVTAQAQAPQLMSFQSVIRNSSGALVTNHSVGLRLSILQGSITGTAVYTETQTATSNANGLVTLQIGGGTVVTGTFSTIDWSAGPYYIKSEIDPTGGTTYGIAGTTQLLSVAYALYANKAGSTNSSASASQGVKIAFSSTSTWTCPTGVTQITVELWGGAGGGGASSAIGIWFSGNNYTLFGNGATYFTSNGFGFNLTGGAGGVGGAGGYNKSVISVIPGTVYNIVVGTGGKGGTSSNNFNGNIGNDGNSSIFNNILSSSGGTGGTGGQSIAGNQSNFTWLGGGGFAGGASSGGGSTTGTNGVSATAVNYTYPNNNYGTRSYIPSSLLTPIPGQSSVGGSGGTAGSFNTTLTSNTSNVQNGNAGSNGEDGYCLISY